MKKLLITPKFMTIFLLIFVSTAFASPMFFTRRVDIWPLANNQCIVYNGTSSRWENLPCPSGGSATLSGLSDVHLTSPAGGQGLIYNATDSKWENEPVSGSGTVTSVALSVPSGFSVTGSPITSSGTLTISTSLSGILKGTGSGFTTATAGTDYLTPFGSQTANYFYAAPNGTTGVPSFRAIVAADIPTLNQSTTGNAATATALAATPSLCSFGQGATGINASGAAQGCTTYLTPTGSGASLTDITFNQIGAGTNTNLLTMGAGGILNATGTGIINATLLGGYAASHFTTGGPYVPTTTTVNGHALTSNITLSASDLTTGTLPHAQLPTLLSGDIPNNAANTTGTSANVTGTVALGNGGTGQTTQQAAINALTGTQSAGKYLRSDGTNATLSAIQAADVPTLNQNTTGTAANITGNLAVAQGGTGVTDFSFSGSTHKAASASGTLIGGDCAKWDASGNIVDAGAACGSGGGGSGTVTSVGLSMPSHFSVSGSPVTASGTLSVTEAAQECASGSFVNGTDANGAITCATPSGGGTAYYGLSFDMNHSLGPAMATRFFSTMNIDSIDTTVWVPVSIGGTAKSIYCAVGTAPGTGYSDVFTFRDNGATPTGAPTCTISGTSTTCSMTTGAATLNAGDNVDIELDINNGAATGFEACSVAVTE